MQSLTNEPFLKKRGKYARWSSYIGIGALIIGLMLSTRILLVSYAFLLVGLVGATLGAHLSTSYVREPRADQVLAGALEDLDKRYMLYNYYLPSNHVVVSHYGLMVLLPKAQSGEVTYSDGHWRHKAGMRKLMQFFGEPSLGKPDADLAQEVQWVKSWIGEHLAEVEVPVSGAVVFTHAATTLKLSSPPVPAMAAAELGEYLRQGLKGQPTLSTANLKELRRTLDELVASGKKAS